MSIQFTKRTEHVQHLAAEFVAREANRTSLVTVTKAELPERVGYGKIYITVMPESQEQATLDFLNRRGVELREFINERAKIGRLPRFMFVRDDGEHNRQRIDELLNQ